MTQIILTSDTTWRVPEDWNSADNSIETIGGGGGGGTSSGGNDAGGGGGGAYSKIFNLALISGATITIQVGTRGSANAAGGDTWFNGTSLAECSVGAKGGGGASGPTGGAGGNQASGVGLLKYSGGNGGGSTNSQSGGAGGGGAGGPNGPGKAGGLSGGNVGSGGGGGGGGDSTAGSDGSGDTGGIGGDGPEGHAAAPGGAGAMFGSSNAVAGVRGSGGGGGTSSTPVQAAGALGGNGTEFDGVHGAGGGGGGGGYHNASNANGGAGGYYGGGGGGTAYSPGAGVGGSGAQGVIVINYTPAAAIVTADAPACLESVESLFATALGPFQFLASTKSDGLVTASTERCIRQALINPIEDIGLARGNSAGVAECSNAVGPANELALPLESGSAAQRQTDSELILEHLAAVFSASHRFPSETTLPVSLPHLLPVSPGRVLRSPGRIRTLAGPGSRHPLRGQ